VRDDGEHTMNNHSPLDPGDVFLGKYRVDRVIGKGAMGLVVAATHIAIGQRVSV
jgi:serine/threonine-protein kinase